MPIFAWRKKTVCKNVKISGSIAFPVAALFANADRMHLNLVSRPPSKSSLSGHVPSTVLPRKSLFQRWRSVTVLYSPRPCTLTANWVPTERLRGCNYVNRIEIQLEYIYVMDDPDRSRSNVFFIHCRFDIACAESRQLSKALFIAPDPTQLIWLSWVELSWVGSGAVNIEQGLIKVGRNDNSFMCDVIRTYIWAAIGYCFFRSPMRVRKN